MNTRQGISLLLLGVIHFVFLFFLIGDSTTNLGVQSLLISSLVFLVFGYARVPRSEISQSKIETLLLPFVIALSGILTYYISIDLRLGPVIASASVGFIASYLPLVSKIFKWDSSFLNALPVPIYCGTFVGMCSSFLTEDYFFIAYAGLAAGLLYVFTRNAFNGIGGKLGTIAFGGVLIVSFIFLIV